MDNLESVGIFLAGLGILLFSFYFLGWVVLEVWILHESKKQNGKNGNGKNGNGKNGYMNGRRLNNVKENNWHQRENNLRERE